MNEVDSGILRQRANMCTCRTQQHLSTTATPTSPIDGIDLLCFFFWMWWCLAPLGVSPRPSRPHMMGWLGPPRRPAAEHRARRPCRVDVPAVIEAVQASRPLPCRGRKGDVTKARWDAGGARKARQFKTFFGPSATSQDPTNNTHPRHMGPGAATVNVRTQEAIEVLTVCLYQKEKLILESLTLFFPKFNT